MQTIVRGELYTSSRHGVKVYPIRSRSNASCELVYIMEYDLCRIQGLEYTIATQRELEIACALYREASAFPFQL